MLICLSIVIYVARVLAALVSTLTNKSETYNDVYLRAIFRMNNLHYIVKALQRFVELIYFFENFMFYNFVLSCICNFYFFIVVYSLNFISKYNFFN